MQRCRCMMMLRCNDIVIIGTTSWRSWYASRIAAVVLIDIGDDGLIFLISIHWVYYVRIAGHVICCSDSSHPSWHRWHISRVPTHSFATGQYISTFIVNKIGRAMAWNDWGKRRDARVFKMMKCAGFLWSILWLSRRHCVASPRRRSSVVLLLERGGGCCISQLSNSNNEVGITLHGSIVCVLDVWVCFFSCCIEVFFWKRSKLIRVEESVQRFISSFL